MAADLQSALVAAGEHPNIEWSLVELNHVLRIFSPAHTPSLPKLPDLLPQMDSNHHLQIQNLTC